MYLEERNHRDDLNHKMMILFLPITKKNVTSESLYYILFIILLLPPFLLLPYKSCDVSPSWPSCENKCVRSELKISKASRVLIFSAGSRICFDKECTLKKSQVLPTFFFRSGVIKHLAEVSRNFFSRDLGIFPWTLIILQRFLRSQTSPELMRICML